MDKGKENYFVILHETGNNISVHVLFWSVLVFDADFPASSQSSCWSAVSEAISAQQEIQ